jgi:hypothetical protein
VIAKETILLQDKQTDYHIDHLTKDLVKNQGVGRCLKGPAFEARVIEVSMTISPEGIINSLVP